MQRGYWQQRVALGSWWGGTTGYGGGRYTPRLESFPPTIMRMGAWLLRHMRQEEQANKGPLSWLRLQRDPKVSPHAGRCLFPKMGLQRNEGRAHVVSYLKA